MNDMKKLADLIEKCALTGRHLTFTYNSWPRVVSVQGLKPCAYHQDHLMYGNELRRGNVVAEDGKFKQYRLSGMFDVRLAPVDKPKPPPEVIDYYIVFSAMKENDPLTREMVVVSRKFATYVDAAQYAQMHMNDGRFQDVDIRRGYDV